MGDNNNGQGRKARRREAFWAACAAACFCAPALAQRAPAKAEVPVPRAAPPVSAAPGVLVQYEEKRNANIVYLEEKGGMLTAPSAIVGEARELVAAPVPVKAPVPAPAPARR